MPCSPTIEMRVWPGHPTRSARPGTASASTSPSSPSTRPRSSCACSIAPTPTEESARIATARADRHGLARLPARRAAGPALRLPRPRPVRAGEAATGSTRTRSCSTRTPRSIGRDVQWDDALFGYTVGARTTTCRSTTRDSAAVRAAGGRHRHRRSPGATTARRARRGTRRSSTRCTSRASRAAPGRARGPPRHLRRPRYRAGDRPPAELGVTAVELLPVHYHLDDRHLVEQGPDELLGLQHARLLRARTPLYARRSTPSARCSEFKTMVRALHAAGIEVILDVVYNHTAEGNQMGPTLSLRASTTPLLPPVAGRPALLHGLHRLRQHAEHAQPARAAAHHGQPAVLGDGDARRRLPLRPRQHARPRAARGRSSSARSSTSSTRTRSCRR